MDVEWDPHRMTEGISDDPVQAAVYGMRNLYAASESLAASVGDRMTRMHLEGALVRISGALGS